MNFAYKYSEVVSFEMFQQLKYSPVKTLIYVYRELTAYLT